MTLSPRYADAHYNLALAYERTGEHRNALRHWRAYVKLDNHGPWADHARGQIRKLLNRENLAIASRADHFIPPRKGKAALELVPSGLEVTPNTVVIRSVDTRIVILSEE